MVAVETLVLCVDKRFPEHRVHVLVLHGSPVLVEELAYELTVGAVYLRSLMGVWVGDTAETGALAEQPQEVDVHHPEIEEEQHDTRGDAYRTLRVPRTPFVQVLVPRPERLDFLPRADE